MIKLYNFDELKPEEILNRDIRAEKNVEDVVDGIIADVRARGDEALKDYALKFDGAVIENLQVTQEEIDEAFAGMDPYFLETLRQAAANIENFHRQQVHKNFVVNDKPGIVLGQKYTPIEKAGVYVPGGTAAYPSTVLMDVIPAKVAAVAFLEQVRAANRTARHNVYAYRLREGNRERYSDDGEPAKTAGTPALEVLQHSGLTDLIVVITRYFGGVLLGTGGLVRAYTTATARALENAEVVTVRSVVELRMTVDYSLYERASLLIDAAGAKQAAPEFADRVTLRWQMPEHTEGPLLEQLRELTRGGAEAAVSEPFYAPF